MLRVTAILVVFALTIAPTMQDSVSASAACNSVGQYYSQGCSGLVKDLLGRPFKLANQYRLGERIGSNNRYSGVQAGTIVGFSGHVAVYIGRACGGCMFVDVPGPNQNARCVRNGYGSQPVYKAYY